MFRFTKTELYIYTIYSHLILPILTKLLFGWDGSVIQIIFIRKLTVPPDINDEGTSGDITVRQGENVTLYCSASGHPEPRILWRREDGTHLIIGEYPRIQKVETFQGPVLELFKVESRHMGAYLCIASNDVPPAVSKRITLHVNFPPKIQALKSLLGVPMRSNVKLKCEVEAFPTSQNFWMKADEMIVNSDRYTIQEKRTGNKVMMLFTVHNVSKSDIGTYTCMAQNSMGKSEDSIRLYEIKIPTTTTTTTTTTVATTTSTKSTTTTTETSLILEITRSIRSSISPMQAQKTEGEPTLFGLFPSVAPASLELENYSRSSQENVKQTQLHIAIPILSTFMGLLLR